MAIESKRAKINRLLLYEIQNALLEHEGLEPYYKNVYRQNQVPQDLKVEELAFYILYDFSEGIADYEMRDFTFDITLIINQPQNDDLADDILDALDQQMFRKRIENEKEISMDAMNKISSRRLNDDMDKRTIYGVTYTFRAFIN